jgi:hypothetical protein
MISPYTLATANEYDDWRGYERDDYAPTARQLVIIDSVRAALAAGLHYTEDVRKHCAQSLAVDADTLTLQRSQTMRVEGGRFGMDCYYARCYLDAVKRRALEDAAHADLAPFVGQKLGALIFNNDFKRTAACHVVAVEGREITLQGKRGAITVLIKCGALAVKYARERVAERAAIRAGA